MSRAFDSYRIAARLSARLAISAEFQQAHLQAILGRSFGHDFKIALWRLLMEDLEGCYGGKYLSTDTNKGCAINADHHMSVLVPIKSKGFFICKPRNEGCQDGALFFSIKLIA
jgi:hypothetical protein